jgi:hypothetical protein
MLSLNSLPDNKNIAREMPTQRPRNQNSDVPELRADFQSIVMTAIQSPKTEAITPAMANPIESAPLPTPKSEISAANSTTPEPKADTSAAQKAGHEAQVNNSQDQAPSEEKESSDKGLQTTLKNTPRPSNDLLRALGLATLTARTSTSTAAQESQKLSLAKQTEQRPAAIGNQTARTQTASTTLSLLQKTPDVVLAQTDGLKRLGEKLGVGFLSKFAEKLNEKPNRQQTTEPAKPESTRGATTLASALQPNKTGHSHEKNSSDADSKSGQRGTRHAVTRNVSRETSTHDNLSSRSPGQTDTTVTPNLANPEIAANRNQQHSTQEIKLSDIAHNAREIHNSRAGVETPQARPDLVRQFNEVMTRAQVLVTDTQNARFSVKLFPREIGRMDIDLKLVDGEMRGKIIVESEEVKSEMQNFLQNKDNHGDGEPVDLNNINIEVRSESQNARNSERAPEDADLLQDLVTRSASTLYEAVDLPAQKGNALYA